ncbi:MAG: hypothetical protein H6510_10510 [Acidobacteria bacterium]|nr:hypothetical protein [Acidobacteriota bacterium]MCB9398241.1 hypothetical protein [Acidobacteriota bacterium]
MPVINLEIQCPECGKSSTIDFHKVPERAISATCNGCAHKFVLDKTKGLNCRIHSTSSVDETGYVDPKVLEEEGGYQVDHPACQGISYTVSGIGGLIRSGLVTTRTMILPPGAHRFFEARELVQLVKYFEQRLKANKSFKARQGD